MKFAHLADLHLGYEQYNQSWRAEDFASAFKRSAELALLEGVDFVIIAGDLFHRSVPSPKTLNDAIEVLKIFKSRNIPVFAVEGNHDKSIREMSAYHLLESLELLNVLGLRKDRIENDFITSVRLDNIYMTKGVFKDIEIIGDRHRTKWQIEKVLPYLKSDRDAILVLHQTVKEAVDIDMNIAWDLTIEQLPEAKYYAMGHIHLRRDLKIGNAFLAYPGSIERYDAREASHFISYGEKLDIREGDKKGFYIVEDFKPRFVAIETRDLYNISIEDEKKDGVENKFLSALEVVKKSGILIAKLLCGENVDPRKLNEIALKRVRYAEISFKRKDLGEIPEAKPEREFFTDFELKLLEILKEDDELSLRSAIELLREYYGLTDQTKTAKVEIEDRKEIKEESRKEDLKITPEKRFEERKDRKFKTLLDFV
ncbi:MAG: exonuclease SbcCD subunit D [Archaeoglobaceae archaeon]|nr:exonuclease SbcCD subunit D [Archaeoglobaceae archaeon]MDW8117890.1 exonuclease SbcCD subunit D [Archaeoglobaceae archaeon]